MVYLVTLGTQSAQKTSGRKWTVKEIYESSDGEYTQSCVVIRFSWMRNQLPDYWTKEVRSQTASLSDNIKPWFLGCMTSDVSLLSSKCPVV